MGKMHSGRIDRSHRHQVIINIFKNAQYPPSAEDIARQAYDFDRTNRIMLNVSTNIGEMRSDENRELGYVISFSTTWKVAHPGEPLGKRTNRDGSITYLIEKATQPWHDGRPRYWLIRAPGWRRRWWINDAGDLVSSTAESRDQRSETNIGQDIPLSTLSAPGSQPGEALTCHYPPCGRQIPAERIAAGCTMTCNDECNRKWRESLRPKFEPAGTAQKSLF